MGMLLTFMDMNLSKRYWVSMDTITSWPVSESRSRRGTRRAWVWIKSLAASKRVAEGCSRRRGGGSTPSCFSMSVSM